MQMLDGQAHERGLGRMALGFRILYRDGEQNHCPACGGQNWIIGRITAECSFCATALPLKHAHGYGYTPRFGIADQPYILADESNLRLVA